MRSGSLLLAWRYLNYYRGRSALLIAALTLTMALPLAVHLSVSRFEKQAEQRAQSTPLVVGARGSRFALTLHALTFQGEAPLTIAYSQLERVESSGLAEAIPLLVSYRAQNTMIVGTSERYLELRRMTLASGDGLERLGDCLLGARVAQTLGVGVGEHLLSDPENAFDLAAPSPLNMRVTGILNVTGTADDDVIFCSLKTAWILAGIGHGHSATRSTKPLDDGSTAAEQSDDEHLHGASRENLQLVNEVTADNESSFHFHGKRSDYPLTAIIALPDSPRSEALLLGQYLDSDETCQCLRPVEVMSELMQLIFRTRRLFDIGAALLALATGMLVLLVVMLSLRLRERELRMFALMGCSKFSTMRIVGSELMIVIAVSIVLSLSVGWFASLAPGWMLELIQL